MPPVIASSGLPAIAHMTSRTESSRPVHVCPRSLLHHDPTGACFQSSIVGLTMISSLVSRVDPDQSLGQRTVVQRQHIVEPQGDWMLACAETVEVQRPWSDGLLRR